MIYRITIVALSAFETDFAAIFGNENAESTIKNVPPPPPLGDGYSSLPCYPPFSFPTRKVHRPRTPMICMLMECAPPSFTAPFSSDRCDPLCLLRATTTTLGQNGDP